MADLNFINIKSLQKEIEAKSGGFNCLEELAQFISSSLYKKFEDFAVLSRVYVSFPYGILPQKNKNFVNDLTESLNVQDRLNDETPILSLMGTSGIEPAWNDRKNSKGHVGIPLISSTFIDGIPMMARLLNELGVDIEDLQNEDGVTDLTSDIFGSQQGIFYVADAAAMEDSQGRKIIAAQDFVEKYGVKTVFGFGGKIPNQNAYTVAVLFTKASIPEIKARLSLTLNNPMRDLMERYFDSKSFFKNN